MAAVAPNPGPGPVDGGSGSNSNSRPTTPTSSGHSRSSSNPNPSLYPSAVSPGRQNSSASHRSSASTQLQAPSRAVSASSALSPSAQAKAPLLSHMLTHGSSQLRNRFGSLPLPILFDATSGLEYDPKTAPPLMPMSASAGTSLNNSTAVSPAPSRPRSAVHSPTHHPQPSPTNIPPVFDSIDSPLQLGSPSPPSLTPTRRSAPGHSPFSYTPTASIDSSESTGALPMALMRRPLTTKASPSSSRARSHSPISERIRSAARSSPIDDSAIRSERPQSPSRYDNSTSAPKSPRTFGLSAPSTVPPKAKITVQMKLPPLPKEARGTSTTPRRPATAQPTIHSQSVSAPATARSSSADLPSAFASSFGSTFEMPSMPNVSASDPHSTQILASLAEHRQLLFQLFEQLAHIRTQISLPTYTPSRSPIDPSLSDTPSALSLPPAEILTVSTPVSSRTLSFSDYEVTPSSGPASSVIPSETSPSSSQPANLPATPSNPVTMPALLEAAVDEHPHSEFLASDEKLESLLSKAEVEHGVETAQTPLLIPTASAPVVPLTLERAASSVAPASPLPPRQPSPPTPKIPEFARNLLQKFYDTRVSTSVGKLQIILKDYEVSLLSRSSKLTAEEVRAFFDYNNFQNTKDLIGYSPGPNTSPASVSVASPVASSELETAESDPVPAVTSSPPPTSLSPSSSSKPPPLASSPSPITTTSLEVRSFDLNEMKEQTRILMQSVEEYSLELEREFQREKDRQSERNRAFTPIKSPVPSASIISPQ